MTHKAPSLGREAIGAPQQAAVLRARCPEFDCSVSNGKMVCRGPLRPGPDSREYRVRIEYRVGGAPRVWIEDPPLSRRPSAPDEPIPHTYYEHQEGKERPCTDRVAWHPGRYIANTTLDWVREWLLHYEIWRQTGVWCGGGVDHNGTK